MSETEDLFAPNGRRYHEFNKAVTREQSEEMLMAFFTDVAMARIKHGIADVHVVVRQTLDCEGDYVSGYSSAHLGNEFEAEAMCAWAFARSGADRARLIDTAKARGGKVRK